MAPFCFAQNRGEASAAKTEALFNAASRGHSGAIAGNSVVLAENPHRTGAVVNLKDAAAEGPKRTADPTGDGNFFSSVPAWIAVNASNGRAGWAARQHYA